MIRSILLLPICLIIYCACHAQQDYEYTFRIQVAASVKPIPKTAKLYKDLPDVEGVKFEDGYIRYFVGKFETYHSSKARLEEVKQAGYKDAYVICIHNGERMTVDEAIMRIYGE